MVPATISFTLRNIFDRVGLISPHQRTGLPSGIRFNRWQRMLAALGDWSAFLNLAWRGEVLLRDRRERFLHFCRDCGEDTLHDGFDEFGVGWYAQICRCRYCGGEGMRGVASRLVVKKTEHATFAGPPKASTPLMHHGDRRTVRLRAGFADFAHDRFIIGDKASVKAEIARYREPSNVAAELGLRRSP